jgi:nucleoside-diphosphate-sugar epimerase
MKTAIVTGAGGFIGHHYVAFLKKKGYRVIGVDVKKPEFTRTQADSFVIADLRNIEEVRRAFKKAGKKAASLYMFAADMGGVGYIQRVHAPVLSNNVLINVHSLMVARELGIKDVFFASSACVYPQDLQKKARLVALKESMAHPADPDSPYGWEKLFTEQAAQSFNRDYGMRIRVARFHNIYGPEGTYQGGREKAPAALCRKVAEAKDVGTVTLWGDGKQTRSFCYIDDCCEGIWRLMQSRHFEPINIGSSELISLNDMAKLIASIAGKKIKLKHDLSQPQGVRGRNSDNTVIRKTLKWEPKISLKKGLAKTYQWVNSQIHS